MPNVPIEKKSTRVWQLDQENKPQSESNVTTGIADSLLTEVIEGPLEGGGPRHH